MVAGDIAQTQTASTTKNTEAGEAKRITGPGLPQGNVTSGLTTTTVEITEEGADHTLVAVDVEATATSIVGDTKIPSYFQLPQRLHHMRMS